MVNLHHISGNLQHISFLCGHNISVSAKDIHKDLNNINNWAFQWKINFNPDPCKKAQESLFSRKLHKVSHLKLFFNNANVSQSTPVNKLRKFYSV